MSPDGFGTHTDPVRAVRFGRSVLGSVFRAMRKGGRVPALSRMRRTGIGLFAKTSGNRTRRGPTVLSVAHRAPDPFRAGLPARSRSVVNLPFPGPPRRSGQGVLCRMPESDRYSLGRRRRSPHGFFDGKMQLFGARTRGGHRSVQECLRTTSANPPSGRSRRTSSGVSRSRRCLASVRRRPSGPPFSCRASARRSGGAIRCRS